MGVNHSMPVGSKSFHSTYFFIMFLTSQGPYLIGGSVYSSWGANKFEGIIVEYLGSTKNGDE